MKTTDTTLPEGIRYRLDVVFAAAALTVLAGMLIPVSLPILDIGWTCSLCLATVTLGICATAQNSHELSGFDFLLGGMSLLRIGLVAATIRKILLEQTAGAIAGFLGKAVIGTGIVTSAILTVLMVIAGVWILIPAARQIKRRVLHYSDEILPVKQAGVKADMSLNVISKEQAKTILDNIRSEMRFFGSMGAIAVLMRCEAAASIILIPIALGIKILTEALAAGNNPEILDAFVSMAAGLAIVSILPAILTGWSSAWLISKESFCLKTTEDDSGKGQTLSIGRVNSRETKEAELLNPDFMQKAVSSSQLKETIVDFEPGRSDTPSLIELPVHRLSPDNTDLYYLQLTEIAAEFPLQDGQAILLTTLAKTPLGVQSAVNTAIGLAGRGFQVLLIDAEPKRGAVALAFDLDKEQSQTKYQKTCIENVFIFTAGQTERQVIEKTAKLLTEFNGQFDKILIYAPTMAEEMAGAVGSKLHTLLFWDRPDSTVHIPDALGKLASIAVIG